MSNQGFRQIFKFDDANLKQLNDSLRWLYSKVTGRVEMRDLSTETKSTIDSKADGAVVGEIKETADQASKDANAAAGAVFEMQGDVEQAKQDSAQAKADAGEAREIVVSMQTSIEQNEEAIKLKADKTTVDALSGTVSEHSAQFEVTAEQISSTVERVDTLNGVVQAHSTSIVQTAEKIESTAKAVQTLDGVVQKQGTAITQTAEKIESKAEKSVVNELGQTVSRHESAITQTPEEIRMAVESVRVGGTNLLPDSKELESWRYSPDKTWRYENESGFYRFQMTESGQTSDTWHMVATPATRLPDGWYGKQITLSAYIWSENWAAMDAGGNAPIAWAVCLNKGGIDRLNYGSKYPIVPGRVELADGISSDVPLGNYKWVRISMTWTLDEAGMPSGNGVFTDNTHIWVQFLLRRNGSYRVYAPKLEFGNKATDWSPAPEDTDAAISELSAAITLQAGEIISNAEKIETVSQAAGKAQDAANAAQNAANGAQNTASGAVTRVTKAEQRISAVEGSITSKVSKEEFDELGRVVSAQETKIEQTDEQVLILAGKTVGGRNYIVNSKGPYVATGTGERQRLWLWRCASVEEAASLYGKTVTISFDYETAITSGAFGVLTNVTWQSVEDFDSYGKTGHVSKTMVINNATTTAATFLYIDGTWTGSVTFSNIKVEIGNTATDWSPHPDDPASGVDAGGVVRVDQTGVHMSGGTIEMETSDGDEYIHIRNDGISASSLSAPDVTPRYSGPGMLYVNPNATSEQIAKGDTFRSLADALSKLSNRWIDKNIVIHVTAGMTEYSTPTMMGVHGSNITINGNGAKLVGGFGLYNGSANVTINNLNVDMTGDAGFSADNWTKMVVQNGVITGTGSGYGVYSTNGASVTVNNSEIYDCSRSLFGIAGGEIDGYACKGNCRVGANRSTLYLHDSMPCDSPTWAAALWAGQVLVSNISVDQGSKPTPIPAPTTVMYDLMHADSYAAGNVNSWVYPEGKPNDDIYQGYTGQAGRICGCMWFDNSAIRSALNGKTIKQASIRLTAQRYVGYGREVTVYLRGTATSYSGRNGPPALTTDYGIIGTAEPAVTGTFTIPAQAISDIASGAIEGLVLYHQDTADMQGKNYSRNYMRFDGSTSGDAETRPRLTVVYQ